MPTVAHRLFSGLAAVALLCLSGSVLAQAWPSKPVRVVVTFPPGGTPDIYGRIMSNELAKVWNQSVVVENRAGASGSIGTDFIAKSAPDGYNLLFAADASITIAPHIVARLPYDPVRDLTPITNVASGPFVLLANAALPVNNVREFVALVRANPGKYTYASSASSTCPWKWCAA